MSSVLWDLLLLKIVNNVFKVYGLELDDEIPSGKAVNCCSKRWSCSLFQFTMIFEREGAEAMGCNI